MAPSVIDWFVVCGRQVAGRPDWNSILFFVVELATLIVFTLRFGVYSCHSPAIWLDILDSVNSVRSVFCSALRLLSCCLRVSNAIAFCWLSIYLFPFFCCSFLCRLASHRILAFFFFQFSFESTMVKCHWMLLAFSTLCSSCLSVNAGFHNVDREIESMKHWIAKNAS